MSGNTGTSASIVLFVFIAILLSVIIYEAKKVVKLPVSPMLLLAGLMLRTLGTYFGSLKDAVEIVDKIDHDSVLLIFMPALIFESSFFTDWFIFKREIWQILPLATTAVGLSACLTAFMFKYVLEYDLTWYESLVFGTMLSATDHVAVVAQLKEIHADRKFELLIQGETLLNEGTVLVLIFVFMLKATDGALSAGETIAMVFQLTLGGIVLGLAFGIGIALWLRKIQNDPVQEINLTLLASYLLFFVSEQVHFSGAIATVTFGLFMSAVGKTTISASSEEKVHDFWLLAGHNIEALVFMLGGMILGSQAMGESYIESYDVPLLFIVFVLLHVIRAIVVAVHFPWLRRMGYGLSFKEAVVLALAGLKGAIAITLSLLMYHNEELSMRVRSLGLFMVVGISALSITFDSLLVKWTVRRLGMECLSKVQENMMIQVTHSLIEKTAKKLEKMKRRSDMKLADWDTVIHKVGAKNLLHRVFRSTMTGTRILKENTDRSPNKLLIRYNEEISQDIEEEEIIMETRKRFLTSLKAIYWDMFEHGQCLASNALRLIEATNRALDHEASPMRDWDFLEKELYSPVVIKFLERTSRLPLVGKWFKNILYERSLLVYDAGSSFIAAHSEAQELIDQKGIEDVNKDLFLQVMKESKKQVEKCKDFIETKISDCYPEVLRHVQTQKAFQTLIHSQRKEVEEIYRLGIIGEIEYEYLMAATELDVSKLIISNKNSAPSLQELLSNRFPDSSSIEITEMMNYTEEVKFSSGEIITSESSLSTGVLLILNGKVKEWANGYQNIHVIGSFLNIENLLPAFPYNLTHSQAVTSVSAARIDINFLVHVPEFELEVWRQSAPKLLILNIQRLPDELYRVDYDMFQSLIKKLEVCKYYNQSHVNLEYGGILLYGSLGIYEELSFIPPDSGTFKCSSDHCVVVHFTESLAIRLKKHRDSMHKIVGRYIMGDRYTITKRQSVKRESYRGKLLSIIPQRELHTFGQLDETAVANRRVRKGLGEEESTTSELQNEADPGGIKLTTLLRRRVPSSMESLIPESIDRMILEENRV